MKFHLMIENVDIYLFCIILNSSLLNRRILNGVFVFDSIAHLFVFPRIYKHQLINAPTYRLKFFSKQPRAPLCKNSSFGFQIFMFRSHAFGDQRLLPRSDVRLYRECSFGGRNDDNYDWSDRASYYLSRGAYDAVLAKGYNTPPRLVL